MANKNKINGKVQHKVKRLIEIIFEKHSSMSAISL
jgi:hypothetical protein